MLHVRIFILSVFVFAALSNYCKAEADAVNVFIESCRNSGENSNLIRSGYAEFENTRERSARSEQHRERFESLESKFKEEMIARFRVSMADAPPEALENTVEQIRRTSYISQGRTDFRYKFLFAGNDIFFELNDNVCKRYAATEQFDRGMWRLADFVIMEGSPNGSMVSAGFMPGTRTATVETAIRPGNEFQRFGRMHMSSAYHTLLSCMDDQERKNFQITEKAIQAFKEIMKNQNYFFEIVGTAHYDGDETATILEIKNNELLAYRFWIDTSRGYICPLIQRFDENGELQSEVKSSSYFLHAETGLWYPERYEEIRHNRPVGVTKNVYALNRDTFRLNHPVSDHMFTLDIPEGTKVVDKRGGREDINYTAMDKGELSLAKGGLDLDKMKWLMREGDLNYGKAEPSTAVQWLQNASISLGILLIAVGIYIKYREWRRRVV